LYVGVGESHVGKNKGVNSASKGMVGSVITVVIMMLLVGILIPCASAESDVKTNPDINGVAIDQVVRINVADVLSKVSNSERITMHIGGEDISFILEERNIYAADMKINGKTRVDDRSVFLSLDRTDFFIGTCLDTANFVSATITADALHMSIELMDGRTFNIDPVDSGGISGKYAIYSVSGINNNHNIIIEDDIKLPIDNLDEEDMKNALSSNVSEAIMNDGSPSIESVIDDVESIAVQNAEYSKVDDEIASITVDGNITSSSNTISNVQTLSVVKTASIYANEKAYITARATLICDYQYVQTYSSDWSSRMATTFWDVCARYEAQVGITFVIAQQISLGSSVCNSYDTTTLLDQFKTYIKANVAYGDRDFAHLWSGKDLNNDNMAKSYLQGARLDRFLGSSYDGYGCAVSEQWHNSDWNSWLLGHEIGHLFGGDTAYAKDWASMPNDCDSWLWNTYGWFPSKTFTDENKQRIRSWAEQALDYHQLINVGPVTASGVTAQVSNLAITGSNGGYVFQVGQTTTVSYSIKNTGTSTLTFDYLFVGARDAAGANKDFGYTSTVTLAAGQTRNFEGTFTPTTSGEWTLWPAWHRSGAWGPYQFMCIHPNLYYTLVSWQGHDHVYVGGLNADLFYRWNLYSATPSTSLKAGSTVLADCTIFCCDAGTSKTTINNLFFGCRNPFGANVDFGHQGQTGLTQKASGYCGGGQRIQAETTLGFLGTWQFWPAYQMGSTYGPYQWHMHSISTVTPNSAETVYFDGSYYYHPGDNEVKISYNHVDTRMSMVIYLKDAKTDTTRWTTTITSTGQGYRYVPESVFYNIDGGAWYVISSTTGTTKAYTHIGMFVFSWDLIQGGSPYQWNPGRVLTLASRTTNTNDGHDVQAAISVNLWEFTNYLNPNFPYPAVKMQTNVYYKDTYYLTGPTDYDTWNTCQQVVVKMQDVTWNSGETNYGSSAGNAISRSIWGTDAALRDTSAMHLTLDPSTPEGNAIGSVAQYILGSTNELVDFGMTIVNVYNTMTERNTQNNVHHQSSYSDLNPATCTWVVDVDPSIYFNPPGEGEASTWNIGYHVLNNPSYQTPSSHKAVCYKIWAEISYAPWCYLNTGQYSDYLVHPGGTNILMTPAIYLCILP